MSRCMSSVLVLVAFSLFVMGCESAADPHQATVQVARNPEDLVPVAGDAVAAPMARKIVFNCQISVVVENFADAQQSLKSLIETVIDHGGYLAQQEVSGSSGSNRRASWTIRVPLARFDGFVSGVEQLGDVTRNTRDAKDVTDAYADLEARLSNKQSSEKRLLSHLEKSSQLKDTLELERELSRVRGEVEQLQGQLNLLKNKTDLATISIAMFEKQRIIPATSVGFVTSVSQTFEGSCKNLITFGQKLTLVAAAVAPWAFVIGMLSIPFFIIRRRQKVSVPGGI